MSSVPWLSDREQQLWRRWLLAQRTLNTELARQLQAESAMSMQDFEVLVLLTDQPQGRLRVSDLARAVQWERSRLSHHLTRMEKRGFVRRAQCPHDGRGAIVHLTADGRRAIEEAAPAHVRSVRALFLDALGEQDVADLDRILQALLQRLPLPE